MQRASAAEASTSHINSADSDRKMHSCPASRGTVSKVVPPLHETRFPKFLAEMSARGEVAPLPPLGIEDPLR